QNRDVRLDLLRELECALARIGDEDLVVFGRKPRLDQFSQIHVVIDEQNLTHAASLSLPGVLPVPSAQTAISQLRYYSPNAGAGSSLIEVHLYVVPFVPCGGPVLR